MTTTPNIAKGTSMFIWQAGQVYGGDANAIIANAQKLGLDGVLIKCANGSLKNDPVSQQFMADFKRLVLPLKKAGLKVGAWIYQYLTDVDGEVDACSQAIDAGADWLILDAEIDVSTLNPDGKTRTPKTKEVQEFGAKLRAKYPNIVIGLSSFAVASYHPEVPFDAYNAFVDVMMPQIYWADMGDGVGTAFTLAVNSYQKFGKPIVPTGQAYGGATPADMAQFVTLCKQAGFTGVSWWDWQHASTAQLAAIAANLIPAPAPQPQATTPRVANDVEADRWSAPAIKWATENKIMIGDGNGNFNPTGTVTREQLAQALYAASHQPK